MSVGTSGNSKLKTAAIGVGALLLVGLLAGGASLYHRYTHPSVYLVNVTGRDGVSTFIDGEPWAQNLKNAASENFSLVSVNSVASGRHKLEAKDASGKVLERFDFVFAAGFGGTYLYSPARDPRVCFIVQTDDPPSSVTAQNPIRSRFEKLDPAKTIWKITEEIDAWFKSSPGSAVGKQTAATSTKDVVLRSLRQAACDDPNFQD